MAGVAGRSGRRPKPTERKKATGNPGKRALNTQATGACASACTLVFVAGERRLLAPQASLGFHRSHRLGEGFGTGWSSVDHFVANFYRTRGVPEDFIQRALGTPGWDLWEPGRERLIQSGVATGENADNRTESESPAR